LNRPAGFPYAVVTARHDERPHVARCILLIFLSSRTQLVQIINGVHEPEGSIWPRNGGNKKTKVRFRFFLRVEIERRFGGHLSPPTTPRPTAITVASQLCKLIMDGIVGSGTLAQLRSAQRRSAWKQPFTSRHSLMNRTHKSCAHACASVAGDEAHGRCLALPPAVRIFPRI
jgi:hypothetical protein